MNSPPDIIDGVDTLSAEDEAIAYGEEQDVGESFFASVRRKKSFQAWHHPVKQIVRAKQWARLTERLIKEREVKPKKIHYFTLPGPDLLDVRVLTDVCFPLDVKIEYFGFDAGSDPNKGSAEAGQQIDAASALRQAGKVADEAIILPDRLEDLVAENSHAATQLSGREAFDIINIDACDHIAYVPAGRSTSTFEAINALLQHQCRSQRQWLLFLTTRVDVQLLGPPHAAMRLALQNNMKLSNDFGSALAKCLDAEQETIGAALDEIWQTHDEKFLKLYIISLAKYLLQFFHSQASNPANVELASCYAYRVSHTEPDMLALAFRVTPDKPRYYPPGIGGQVTVPNLEPGRAIEITKRAGRLWDLDDAIVKDEKIRNEAIEGTKTLLNSANFDLDEWVRWLATHARRPMEVTV